MLHATFTAYIDIQKINGYNNTMKEVRKAFSHPDYAPQNFETSGDDFKDFVRIYFHDYDDAQKAMYAINEYEGN